MAKGMTKTEALEKIKELEYHIKNKKKDILVPDCIKIEGKMWKSDSLGIVFNEGRQTLYGNSIRDTFVWFVNPTYRSYYVKAKLVEVDVKDLEPWQLYFHTDNNEVADSELEDINFYAIYLWDGKYAKTNWDVMLYNVERSHWYKVVEITE